MAGGLIVMSNTLRMPYNALRMGIYIRVSTKLQENKYTLHAQITV